MKLCTKCGENEALTMTILGLGKHQSQREHAEFCYYCIPRVEQVACSLCGANCNGHRTVRIVSLKTGDSKEKHICYECEKMTKKIREQADLISDS